MVLQYLNIISICLSALLTIYLQVQFLAPFPYHLNVSQTSGNVCLGLLSKDKWDTTSTMECVLQAIIAILIRPEPSNSMDHATLNSYCQSNFVYNSLAKKSAEECAKVHRKMT